MRGETFLRALVVTLLAAAALWADEPWNDKPYTEWTVSEIARIMNDSPWAQKVPISGVVISAESAERRGGYTSTTPGQVVTGASGQRVYLPGTPTVSAPRSPDSSGWRPTVLVQWFSSLTIRQALVRQNDLSAERVREFLEDRPSKYVILVTGFNFKGVADQALIESASLTTEGSTVKIHPVSVTKQGALVWFSFPREVAGKPLIGPDSQKVEFELSQIKDGSDDKSKKDSKNRKSSIFPFKATFHPREMLRKGVLDI